MNCCDLTTEVTGCLLNANDEAGPCERCPMADKFTGSESLKESLEAVQEEEFEEGLI